MGALTSQADFKLFKYMMDFWVILKVLYLEYVKNKATYQKKDSINLILTGFSLTMPRVKMNQPSV